MKEQDDLQELWQSQAAAARDHSMPNFGLMEDLAAPVQFSTSSERKWSTTFAFVVSGYSGVRQLRISASTWEEAACWLSIAASLTGLVLVMRQRSDPMPTNHDQSVEEFRTDLAREYNRQSRAFQWPYVLSLVLAWASLLAAEVIRSVRQGGPTLGFVAIPVLVAVCIYGFFRYQRTFDERAIRRILRGY